MAKEFQVKVGGAWKAVKTFQYKVSGAWKEIKLGQYKVGGAWKDFFSGSTLTVTLGTYVSGTDEWWGFATTGTSAPSTFGSIDPTVIDGVTIIGCYDELPDGNATVFHFEVSGDPGATWLDNLLITSEDPDVQLDRTAATTGTNVSGNRYWYWSRNVGDPSYFGATTTIEVTLT